MKKKNNKKKKKNISIKLKSTKTSHFYTTTKNSKTKKLTIKKFDPIIRKHIEYIERKIT